MSDTTGKDPIVDPDNVHATDETTGDIKPANVHATITEPDATTDNVHATDEPA